LSQATLEQLALAARQRTIPFIRGGNKSKVYLPIFLVGKSLGKPGAEAVASTEALLKLVRDDVPADSNNAVL
jgi:hypothetical protein